MTLKEEIIQKTDLLFQSGCIDGIPSYDTDELQKIADEQGNGCLVQGDRWTRSNSFPNLYDGHYQPDEGDLIYFDGNVGYAYYIVQYEDVCEEPSEEL